jgi:hypothetical protein
MTGVPPTTAWADRHTRAGAGLRQQLRESVQRRLVADIAPAVETEGYDDAHHGSFTNRKMTCVVQVCLCAQVNPAAAKLRRNSSSVRLFMYP